MGKFEDDVDTAAILYTIAKIARRTGG